MKALKTIILVLFLISSAKAQVLSPKAKAKAEKKATAEAKMYQKKGFTPANTTLSLHDLLLAYYKHSLLESDSKERVYISSQSKASNTSQQQALKEALQKAANRVPSLMAMYYNSWVSVDKRTSLEEKNKIIKAINKVNKDFAKQLKTVKPDFTCQLVRSKKGKINAQVRVLYKQGKIRKLYRKIIVDYLVKSKDFDRKEIEDLLIFETK